MVDQHGRESLSLSSGERKPQGSSSDGDGTDLEDLLFNELEEENPNGESDRSSDLRGAKRQKKSANSSLN